MSFTNDYKTISSFYKSGNEDVKTSCLKDFDRRVENSSNDIKNIGDINKINMRNTETSNDKKFSQHNFYNIGGISQNTHNLKTNIPYMRDTTHNNYEVKVDSKNFIQPTFYNSSGISQNTHNLKTNTPYTPNIPYTTNKPFNNYEVKANNENFEMSYTRKKYKNTSSPDVFGPPLWFTLHNGSSKYPHNPGNLAKERMKYFILGIPIMIPCTKCREDATAYIEKHKDSLDDICSSRIKLFEFFFTFHNVVNKKLNKPLMTYENAIKLYSDDVEIDKLSF